MRGVICVCEGLGFEGFGFQGWIVGNLAEMVVHGCDVRLMLRGWRREAGGEEEGKCRRM